MGWEEENFQYMRQRWNSRRGKQIEERLIMEAWKGILSNHRGKGTIMQESGFGTLNDAGQGAR